MDQPLTRTLPAAVLAALLLAAPAAADTAATGGVAAQDVPVLGPSGGVAGPSEPPRARAAQAAPETPAREDPASSVPHEDPITARDAPEAHSTQNAPADQSRERSSGGTESTASSSGGALPHTGFALAFLIALGTCFFLTGYALRYSRALDR
jgi:hypothetical protein